MLLSGFLWTACSFSSPGKQMEKLARQYDEKTISNYQMLLGMGTVYFSNPENVNVKKEYFSRMIVSGYGSWVLHYYLAEPEKIKNDTDKNIILSALLEGNHYDMAKEFLHFFRGQYFERLQHIVDLGDSLDYFNETVYGEDGASAFAGRGGFFALRGEDDMATVDLNRSLRLDPCGEEALFRRILILFDRENTNEIIRLLNNCPGNDAQDHQQWRAVFYQLARDVESVHHSGDSDNDKLFRLSNLYLNSGFERLALRNSGKLVRSDQDNPDYLALHAFVYYRLGNKRMATRYIDKAENITGRNSRLRVLIEQMNPHNNVSHKK